MIKFLWVYMMAFLFCAGAIGQDKVTLSGAVTDKAGKPVVMATVAVSNTSIGTYTDEKGRYVLMLAVGKHTITVSSVGYKKLVREMDIRKNRKQDFVLEENTVSLNVVDIYGKTEAQKIKEGVFTAGALDVKPQINTIHSLTAMVNRSSGVKVREDGGVGSDFELSINGLSGNSVRYFIDGMPLSVKGSGISLANLPVNIIDRVEIYKGVVPAHLGADALGGAVNIITKHDRLNYLDFSYGVGSFHTHKADFSAQYHEKRTGILFRPSVGMNSSKNDYLMKGVELWNEEVRKFVPVDRRRFHDGYFSLFAQLEAGVRNRAWADEFFVSASYSSSYKELQTGSIQTVVYGDAKREKDAWNVSARYVKNDFPIDGLKTMLSVSQTWDHSLTTDTAFRKYKWDGSYIETSRSEIMGRDRMRRHFTRPMTMLRTSFDYRINAHHGMNLNYLMNRTGNKRRDDVDSDFEPSDDVFAKHILALSYDQRLVNDRLQNTFFLKNYTNYLHVRQQDLAWITGAREVEGSSVKNHTGYGLASRYGFADAFSVKASYEHSLRLPRSRELLGNGTTVYPNLKLKPENSDNFNLGLFGTLYPAGRHSLSYELNAFYRDVKDYIRPVISESEGLTQYDNVASVAIKGLEGEVRYAYDNLLHVIANCSYEDARSMTRYYPDGKETITYKNRIPNRPWLFGNLEVNLTKRDLFGKRTMFRAGYTFEYVHWFYFTWEGYGALSSKSRIPTQQVHNVYISQSFVDGRYNVSLSCENLFDRTAYDNFKLQKPGRSFFCKFRIFIN